MKLSQELRKVIILYYGIAFFAFFVNIAELDFHDENENYYLTTGWQTASEANISEKHFWPFVDFSETTPYNIGGPPQITYFKGVFYQFDFLELAVYGTIPLLILFAGRFLGSSDKLQ